MSKADSVCTPIPSRRKFLAAGSAAAVFASLHDAVAAEAHPDQHIFAMRDKIRADERTIYATDDPAESDAACEAYTKGIDAILCQRPQTAQGIRAILECASSELSGCELPDHLVKQMVDGLLASPALAP